MTTSEISEFDAERILFHGSGLLVVDKPAGLPVHRGTGHPYGLVDSLGAWISLHPRILNVRPGKKIHPINLVDQEASGVILFAFTKAVARNTKAALTAGRVDRRTLAVVAGPLPREGSLKGKVRSRLRGLTRYVPSSLRFRKIEGDERLSLVEVIPGGGQTHLVRSLFAQDGHPIAGDTRYGKPGPCRKFLKKFDLPHFLLHVRRLTIPKEILGGGRAFDAPVPETFEQLCHQKGWDMHV